MKGRVYLMADRGNGPQSLGRVRLPSDNGATYRRDVLLGGECWALTTEQARLWGLADKLSRWWLVEAENADAARETIAHWDVFKLDHPLADSEGTIIGRILASGGRS